eukprot:jgi/Tetstr1/428843/TSEL_018830.t1
MGVAPSARTVLIRAQFGTSVSTLSQSTSQRRADKYLPLAPGRTANPTVLWQGAQRSELVAMDAMSELRLNLKRQFLEFLDLDNGHGEYADRIDSLLGAEEKGFRLQVDVADVRSFDFELHQRLMNEPAEAMPAFEAALEETVRSKDPKWLPEGQPMRVALTGEFGAHTVSPRQLLAPLMGKMVNLQGIVTKASLVRPKMVRSVHYCEATKATSQREYRDVTSHDGAPTGASYPTKDDEGNLLSTEFGLCIYRNSQVLTVQELPETSPPGQLPRSVDIIVEEDLVDVCKPGDRVEVAGIYKAIAPQGKGIISGIFRALVCACGVHKLTREIGAASISRQDIINIKEISRRDDVLSLLGASLAPSIFGHSTVKEALILLLLGGVEKNLANGAHLRGDINCLLVGDPGVAKSQLLRSVMNIAPLAVNTTGRGSSGVGLTAAVTVDKDTGEKRLEAGAMVLADRGVVCIDEFDKMSDLDRVAIHEVMEQQTVTIAKAGIHTTLNARCSVVAAANPLYGSYEASLDKAKNINLPDSLLSRFDCIFVMLDELKNDEAISAHVLGQHQYRAPGDDQGIQLEQDVHALLGLDEDEVDATATDVHVQFNKMLHGGSSGDEMPLTSAFLKKFIHYAKSRVRPELSPEASEEIAAYYTSLRQFQACPRVTVRMLETIIRLSTAHAKMKHKLEVEAKDVEAIKRILDAVTGFSSEVTEVDDLEKTAANSMRSMRAPARTVADKGAKRPGREGTREGTRSGRKKDVDADEAADDSEAEDDDDVVADAAEGDDDSEGEADEEPDAIDEDDEAGPSEPVAVGGDAAAAEGDGPSDPVLAVLVTKVLKDLLQAAQQSAQTSIAWTRLTEEVHTEEGSRRRKYTDAAIIAEATRQVSEGDKKETIMADADGLYILA